MLATRTLNFRNLGFGPFCHSTPPYFPGDKAANQQYLTPCEEKASSKHILRMSERGYPFPVKFLCSLELVIARQRSCAFQIPTIDDGIRLPGKN
jgi:hypothetical protein